MSKAEMLMEYNTQDIIEFIMSDLNIDYDEAMKLFYSSETFEMRETLEKLFRLKFKKDKYGNEVLPQL